MKKQSSRSHLVRFLPMPQLYAIYQAIDGSYQVCWQDSDANGPVVVADEATTVLLQMRAREHFGPFSMLIVAGCLVAVGSLLPKMSDSFAKKTHTREILMDLIFRGMSCVSSRLTVVVQRRR